MISKYQNILEDVLKYSRQRGYTGYDKHDGMSSQVLQQLPVDYRWVNLCIQETIKRAPINLRPLFAVEQRQSPVGLSLFTLANLEMYNLTNKQKYIRDANLLINRVIEFGSNSSADGFALPHNHELQRIDKKIPQGTPRIVATTWGVEALVEMADWQDPCSELAHSVLQFIQSQLDPESTDQGIRLKYKPTDDSSHYTINANAVTARMFAELYDDRKDPRYRDFSEGILRYVANQQQPVGGWYYRDPPSASHLSMDNYHNGYIIESFIKHHEIFGGTKFENTLEDGLSFYRDRLFESNGAPNWDEQNTHPKDICAVAQGVIVFSEAGRLEFARRILDWSLENLYQGGGKFYYQRCKFYTKKFTLMRWCQAWMAYALATYLKRKNKTDLST